MTPLVSVLIPAFNASPWIRQTLESVIAQTWRPIEILVADGGSSDATAAVVREYSTSGVRLLTSARGAQSAAMNRNRALRAAHGDFIQFLDADDLISADKIERQVRRLDTAPAAVASAEWARFTDAPSEARFEPESVWMDLDPAEWLIRSWTGGGGMMQPGLWLIPRTVIERAGEWDERLTLIDDFEFGTRLLLASDGVCFCEGARVYYRSGRSGSLSQQRSPAAWRSAFLSMDLGTRALMHHTGNPRARAACADLFQQLAFSTCIDDPETSRRAEARSAELGGSSIQMGGGLLFGALRRALGWKAAARVKHVAYGAGYGWIARRPRVL